LSIKQPNQKVSFLSTILIKQATIEQTIDATASKEITLDMSKTFGWYDLSIKLKDSASFERRYAGRVETGSSSKTDPLMGKAV
jgi:phospholipase C